MNLTRIFSCLAIAALACSTGFAQETSSESAEKCTKCPHSTTAAVADQEDGSCGSCPIMAAAMEKLPRMTFQVGDELTCCSESAAALAKKQELPVQFVVAETTYDDKTAAYTALVETTEEFVNTFVTPCKCDVSGATTVAGKTCNCPVTSARNAELVSAAVEQVQMTYQVGEKTCNCPMQAATLAKKSDAQTEYVVGDQKTGCQLTARLNLARARYQAAVAAINTPPTTGEDSETDTATASNSGS